MSEERNGVDDVGSNGVAGNTGTTGEAGGAPRWHPGRRSFLGALLALLAALSGAWGIRREWVDAIRSVVAHRLDFLDIDPAGLTAFGRDVEHDARVPYPPHFNLYSRMPVQVWRWMPDRDALARLERYVVQKYLLSTDFFPRGADESRTVRYVAYFDRYERPCTNPFLRS